MRAEIHPPFDPWESGGRTVRWGCIYDVEEWREFLGVHGFDIDHVAAVDVWEDGRVTVHQYRVNERGRKFLDNEGEVAMYDPVTITPELPIPTFT